MYFGSLVALVTPMGADGEVDFKSLERLIDWHVGQGTSALVIAGTTGESATLTKEEHLQVIRHSAEYADGRLPVIAGTGSNSTAQTIDLSVAAGEAPIDGYLVVTPYYNKPTQDGLVQHFRAIADAVTKPIMLYNVPGRTAVDMVPETVARLAGHERIFGIKEATGEVNRVAELRELCGEDFLLYSGDDPTAREFLLAGGCGVVSVTANVAPEKMAAMCEAALAGNSTEAARVDETLAALHNDLFVEANPIPVKWALQRMGMIPEGIRLPLTPLSEAHRARIESGLRQAGCL
jgi:4-hydroxy-tetrahydrodipicolinate synthase